MATKKLTCTADVSISQKYPGQAYNGADRLAFGSGSSSGDTYYALLNFSSLGLTDTTYKVTKAVLYFTKIDGAIGYNASFYARALRITSSWSESTTYDNQPSVTTTGTPAAVAVGTGHSGSVSLDVTSIVQSWLSGSAQYGIRLEKTTSGTSLLKCIGSRTSSSAAYITVTYENKNPAPTTPTPKAPGKITRDSVKLSWSASTDNIFSSSQLAYRVQINFGSGDSSSFYTDPGVTSYTINLKEYLGLNSSQYYYNKNFTFAVSAYTPSYNGTVYYSSWARSTAGTIDYRISPGAPSAPSLSDTEPYEGQTITATLSRPSSYNAYNAAGSVMQLTYKIMLATGKQLASITAPVTSASVNVSISVGNFTSGKADLATQVYATCTDQAGQASGQSAKTNITVKRFRAPCISVTAVEREATNATVRISVSDTGYGSAQGNAQIESVEYKLDSGEWSALAPTWTGLKGTLTIPDLLDTARYALSVRATNTPPEGLAGKTSAIATATILEYTPAMMVFRDSANGASGIAAKSLIVGEDWSGQVAEGDASIEGKVTAYRLIVKDTDYPTLQFMDSDDGSVKTQVLGNMARNITYFRNWCLDTEYYENYLTPDPDTGRTKNGNYKLLTTKETADYVVAQGSSGGWVYKKWNSGRAECIRYLSTTPTTVSGTNSLTVTLPFTFSTATYVVQITKAANGFLVSDLIDANGAQNSGHTTSSFMITYKYTSSTAYALSFSVSVAGAWK